MNFFFYFTFQRYCLGLGIGFARQFRCRTIFLRINTNVKDG